MKKIIPAIFVTALAMVFLNSCSRVTAGVIVYRTQLVSCPDKEFVLPEKIEETSSAFSATRLGPPPECPSFVHYYVEPEKLMGISIEDPSGVITYIKREGSSCALLVGVLFTYGLRDAQSPCLVSSSEECLKTIAITDKRSKKFWTALSAKENLKSSGALTVYKILPDLGSSRSFCVNQ